jgi:hypothetical protein
MQRLIGEGSKLSCIFGGSSSDAQFNQEDEGRYQYGTNYQKNVPIRSYAPLLAVTSYFVLE